MNVFMGWLCYTFVCVNELYEKVEKMVNSSKNSNADYNAYRYGWYSALTYAQDKVQEMHDKKFYELVMMFKGTSTFHDRVRKTCEIEQLEKILEMLEDMK